MKNVRLLSAIAFVFALGLFQGEQAGFGASEAHAKLCYRGGQAFGEIASGADKSAAEERARDKWRDHAIKLVGSTEITWNEAIHRGYSCKQKDQWYCRAIATPCL